VPAIKLDNENIGGHLTPLQLCKRVNEDRHMLLARKRWSRLSILYQCNVRA